MNNLRLYIAIGQMRTNMQSIREDIRELRSDFKLLTGKVYEMMGQK